MAEEIVEGGTPAEVELEAENDEDILDPAGEPEEGEDEEDDTDEPSEVDAEPASPRGRQQFGRLRQQQREAQERADRVARENAELTRQLHEARQVPRQQGESPEQRQARYNSIMDPEERVLARWRDEQATERQQNNAVQFQLLDTTDRTAFQSFCVRHPVADKLSAEVERRLGELRRAGQNMPREAIFTYLLGERMRERIVKGTKGKPSESRRRNTARPANGGGDVRPNRQARRAEPGSATDFEGRYGDVPI